MDEIKISVVCMVYNHEKYLRECLDGFLMQKTDFKYEVLIHDDASTDSSQSIIREYEEKYPDIIKPIYQTENQYSKGVKINLEYQYPRARGKYIALCEGDDCWIDENKLQKQFDYMEANPECTLCFTNALYKVGNDYTGKVLPLPLKKEFFKGSGDYSTSDMIYLDFVPTASLFFPRYIVDSYPDVRKESFHGDTLLRIYAASCGYAHCIDEPTCIYRRGVDNSATVLWAENIENKIKAKYGFIYLYEDLDKFTDYKYHDAFEYNIVICNFYILMAKQEYKQLRSKVYKNYMKRFGKKDYYLFVFKIYFPFLYSITYGKYKALKQKRKGK